MDLQAFELVLLRRPRDAYRTGSLEEARRLAEGDPAVRAGRLEVDVIRSYCLAVTMAQPGRAMQEPD